MRINNNISALNAWRGLTNTDNALGKSLEKLSSGLRINRAGDDAAGLAISEKMRGQIRGLNQAMRNAQDGISLIQTAEGALTESHAILQRMRELAVQAANDTNTDKDREEIQKEINQLAKEVNRIAQTTQFNTMNLLDGTFTAKVLHIGANNGQKVELGITNMDATSLGVSSGIAYKAQNLGTDQTITVTSLTGDTIVIELKSSTQNENPAVTSTTAIYDPDNRKITVTLKQAAGDQNNPGAVQATYDEVLSALESVASQAGITVAAGSTGYDGSQTVAAGDIKEYSLTGWEEDTSANDGINVSSQSAADAAISVIDIAIGKVSAERSKLGAMQNRLEHTIKNLGVAAENLTAAESRIRDVDMAQEMMNFTKQTILMQAGTAMLAQANARPQSVLQLLG